MGKNLIQHPALYENLYKDIPKVNVSRISTVSASFGIAEVTDFDPDGDRAGKSIPWQTISKAVLARDNYSCRICGGSSLSPVDSSTDFRKIHFELEVHHIIPRKDGGSDTFRNLITLCEDCHKKTFSKGYAGVPVSKELDLFSFERKLMFVLPQEEATTYGGEKRSGILLDYRRVFDADENRYRVVAVQGSKLNVTIVPVTIEEYRKIVSDIVMRQDVHDYLTIEAQVSGINANVRVLTDSSADLIV